MRFNNTRLWQAAVRGVRGRTGASSVLPMLHGGIDGNAEDAGIEVAADSLAACLALLDKLGSDGTAQPGSCSCTLRWMGEASDTDGLSSLALLSTILESCDTAFLQCDGRGFRAFCQTTAISPESVDEDHLCHLALGQATVRCPALAGDGDDGLGVDGFDGGASDAELEMDSVPILFVPVLLHSATAKEGSCTIEPAGAGTWSRTATRDLCPFTCHLTDSLFASWTTKRSSTR
eukprot:SAG22_NODE_5761_length_957_cov_2.286713_1_plen_232_part_10